MTYKLASIAAVFVATLGIAGCGSDSDSNGPIAGPDQNVTASDCSKTIEKAVLERALALSETASIISSKKLYGEELSFADAVLVRVSDEVEPTDYLVVRSKMSGNVVDPKVCSIKKIELIDEGVLPQDDALVDGDPGVKCADAIKAKVLEQAKKRDETASITGLKMLYGGGRVFGGGVVIVRVSDEVEPTDYVATFSRSSAEQKNAGECTVGLTELVNEGVLPDIGL